jgi:proline iminopeptidase
MALLGCSTQPVDNPDFPESEQTSKPGSDSDSSSKGKGSGTKTEPSSNEKRTTDLFHQTFGDKANRPVVFLHGGPGGNSIMFETAAAEDLAKRGNFVVTYDQRGSGRSPAATEKDFTFEKVTQDLDDLISTLGLKSPVLLAHSWGGTLAVKFMELHPGVAKGAILVGNPVDYPDSIFNIHARCTANYKKTFAFPRIQEVEELHARMFPNGRTPPFNFTSEDFGATMNHAVKCGLDFPKQPTANALKLWASVLLGGDREAAMKVDAAPGAAYQKNERLLDLEFRAQFAKANPTLYAIYGADDGLLSAKQLDDIRSIVSPAHFNLVQRSSHVVYLDQHDEFLDIVSKDMDEMSAR